MPRTDITKNQIRKRQFEPKLCKKGTFRTKKVSRNTQIILCKKKGSKKQSVQSIRRKRN